MDLSEPGAGLDYSVVDVNAPFTKAERLQQLSEIDQDIASLLEKAGRVIGSLKPNPDSAPDPSAELQDPPQLSACKAATDDFFATLQSVNIRLKRQIYGLEEAGIITLSQPTITAAGKTKPKGELPTMINAIVPPVQPNGVGGMGAGNLDVGWLNSRSNKVDRDMEAELWARARQHLESVAAADANGAGTAADYPMSG
ncbi:hypothetical protein MGG_06741 [Pyricularia oryzae 70-15]|uniref:Mediator of RNA polymerase II transcription subunit 11 n=3 Tax=Pyricularia oryzae TaxID=318829 RepID=G4MLL0_PYRO7|nr:uncharacterized protein MGG_06741 [Pyricularia oryzae 70-15]EHA56843.1 hypothetical protein MGG_06741 [Pyricularia oryzae 70-15]ELQ38558.1 hypothetical protein OOU_Y34scaffold00534g33 [Pyricularia oryzae Y34]KAI7918999.1 hypothetical protein M9X92_006605 [Pyricularia oryzae]KAI7929146.1 hypothetical protein M0657_002404 [Pyricularia oryzae]